MKNTLGKPDRESGLRVALLPEYFYPHIGGGENWFRNIGSGLAARGHQVDVFTFRNRGSKRLETIEGMNVRRFGIVDADMLHPYITHAICSLASFISHPVSEYEYDVVVGQGTPLIAALPTLIRKSIPSICVVHDIYGLKLCIQDKGFLKGLARYLALEKTLTKMPFSKWIAVSDSTKQKLSRMGVPEVEIAVVRNGVKEMNLDYRAERNSITFLGRLVRHKHPEDFVLALSRLENNGNWVANIAGDGELLPELRQFVRKLGLESRVSFLGLVNEEEKARLLGSSICLVLPSMAEGWAVALTEAAAAKTPSIAYDIPGVREQAGLIPSILLVKPRHVAALAAKISQLLTEVELARKLGEAGRNAVANITWDASAKGLEELLYQVKQVS